MRTPSCAYAQEVHRTWKNDWRYFTTDSLVTIED